MYLLALVFLAIACGWQYGKIRDLEDQLVRLNDNINTLRSILTDDGK